MLRIIAVLGALAVVLGALGAHTLGPLLSPERLAAYKDAALYHIAHVLGLLVLAVWAQIAPRPARVRYTEWLWIAGIFAFSGSVYLLSCRELLGIDGLKKIIGPITPLGGLCFILGWLNLALLPVKPSA